MKIIVEDTLLLQALEIVANETDAYAQGVADAIISTLEAAEKAVPDGWTTDYDLDNVRTGFSSSMSVRSMQIEPAFPPKQVIYLFAAPVASEDARDAARWRTYLKHYADEELCACEWAGPEAITAYIDAAMGEKE